MAFLPYMEEENENATSKAACSKNNDQAKIPLSG